VDSSSHLVLCGGSGPEEQRADARLVEAQAAFDDATKLRDAGKYADAIRQGERSLALREAVLAFRRSYLF
jgi:hypothetical protein